MFGGRSYAANDTREILVKTKPTKHPVQDYATSPSTLVDPESVSLP